MDEKPKRGRPRKETIPDTPDAQMQEKVTRIREASIMLTGLIKDTFHFYNGLEQPSEEVKSMLQTFFNRVTIEKKRLDVLQEFLEFRGKPVLVLNQNGTISPASEKDKLKALIRKANSHHMRFSDDELI